MSTEVPLSSFLRYRKGKPPRGIGSTSQPQLPVLSPEYLRGAGKPELTASALHGVPLDGEEIVLLWDGSNAGEFFRAKRGLLASTMVAFDFDDTEIEKDYLFYELKRFEPALKALTSGSGIPHVDKEILLTRRIRKPHRAAQKKISEVLSAMDRAIEQTEALIAKYQRIKAGLMQDLLTRGIDEQGCLRDPTTHKFKPSPVGPIPTNWKVSTLGRSAELHNNLRKPISALVRETMQGPYPYYGATGIVDYINEYRVEGQFVLIGEDGDHFLKYLQQEMTILTKGKFNVNNHAHLLRGKNECSTDWIHHFFCHRDITFHLTRQGAGRLKLNKATLLSLPLAVPSPEEQAEISQRLFTIKRSLEALDLTLKKLLRLKTGLMQDLLTGKVSIEPLLETHTVR